MLSLAHCIALLVACCCWCSHAHLTDDHEQAAEKTSRIKPVHVYGLLALNPGPIDKNNSKEVMPQHVSQNMVPLVLNRTFPGILPVQEALSAAASTTASPMQVLGMHARA
jgi:hypothetical protein